MEIEIRSFVAYISIFFILIISSPVFAQNAYELVEHGKEKQLAGVYTEAIKDFTEAIKLDDSYEEAYYHRGEAYFEIGRYQDALQDLNRAIELEPQSSSMSYYKRGLVHNVLNQLDLALLDFNEAIKIAPAQELYFVRRADLYRKRKQYFQALNDCQKALELVPDYYRALSVRGLIQLDKGQADAAYKDLSAAVAEEPNDSELHNNLAYYYDLTGQYQKALEEFTAAINLDSRNAQAYYDRARLKLFLGNNAGALKDAKRAIYNNRRYLPAYIIRGIASFNTNEFERYKYDVHIYMKTAHRADDYFFIADYVEKYVDNPAHETEILTQAEQWAAKAVELEDSYKNNLVYARILFKLRKTVLAQQHTQIAIKQARKLKIDASQALFLKTKIAKENTDNTPPVIQITSPVASVRGIITVESADKLTVLGVANDESGIEKVLINGNPARLTSDGHFDGQTLLSEGKNFITVRAFDNRGNEATKSFVAERKAKPASNPPPVASKLTGKNRALLIATNYYDSWGDLANPVSDARAIREDLERIYGFEVQLLENPNKETVMLTIKDYIKQQYESNDQLFIFFAGHGQFDEIFKEGYVVAKDSKYDDESKASYISYANLRTYINSIPCRHVFLVMDVCFGGTIDRALAMRGAESDIQSDREEFINRKLRYKTRRFYTSGGKEYVPDGRPGYHSPFVRRFLEALRSEGGVDQILTIAEIVQFFEGANPNPHYGEFGDNEPGSDFLFIKSK